MDKGCKPAKKEEAASTDEIVAKVLKGITDTLGERISKLETVVTAVAQKADEAKELAANTDKTLGGMVFAPSAGDRTRTEVAKKSDEGYEFIDTAYEKLV